MYTCNNNTNNNNNMIYYIKCTNVIIITIHNSLNVQCNNTNTNNNYI